MNIPAITSWYGMKVIVNDTVPDGGYVITDADGEILSGGDLDSSTCWLKRFGNPAFVYANENVAHRLIMGGRENGARYTH